MDAVVAAPPPTMQPQPITADGSTGSVVHVSTNTERFYRDTVRQWLLSSEVSTSYGATMHAQLHIELDRIQAARDAHEAGMEEYGECLNDVYRTISDALLSAVHRYSFHYHLNRQGQPSGVHVATDEEEIDLGIHPPFDTDEEDDESASSVDEEAAKAKVPSNNVAEQRAKKKEELKRRREEEERLLLNDRKVHDDKGNLVPTIGPFPAPRLTIRSLKPGHQVPSRKSLTQRSTIDQEESSEEDDEVFVPATQGPSEGDEDAAAHLKVFMAPLSSASLKKISESAKVKLRAGASNEEFIMQIVKSAIRLGCEKACVLMDKHKIIDAVAAYAHSSRTHILAQLGANLDFLYSLPEDLRRALAPVIGMPRDNCSVPEMWERIMAMGLCSVLTNLRPRPLKRIAQELNIQLNETASTEKHCEAIVFSAFPREAQRVKQSKAKKHNGVTFAVDPAKMRTFGDMGIITFVVSSVSCMRKDFDRHYSPEFEYGNLRWSLLCMANKDNLALYLCQTGTVHCKFAITVVNHINADDSITNEGTQRFSSASAENDWGFNNVMRFDALLDPKNGFWLAENDSITIDVGIVLVESVKVAQAKPQAAKSSAPPPDKRINQDIANQLLEGERLEIIRKRVKNDMARTVKDEEKQRKETLAKQQKSWQTLVESFASERSRIVHDSQEKERREQQERLREQERVRQLQEQTAEMKRKLNEATEENAELQTKKKTLMAETKQLKQQSEQAKQDLAAVDKELAALQDNVRAQEAEMAATTHEVNQLQEFVASTPIPEEPAAATPDVDESEIMRALQQSLAGIIGH